MSPARRLVTVVVLLLVLVLLARFAEAGTVRSSTTVRQFVRANPCPATGLRKMPCFGHVVDHKRSLGSGGADSPANLQYQTRPDSLRKDREEAALHAMIRRGVLSKSMTDAELCATPQMTRWPYTAAAICNPVSINP